MSRDAIRLALALFSTAAITFIYVRWLHVSNPTTVSMTFLVVVLVTAATAARVWVAMVTQAGATVDEDFPGIAALIDPSGEIVARLPDWRPGTLVVDLPLA